MAYSAESMSRAGQRSGFSASNAVRRGSPSGRVLPGRSAPSQLELVPQRRLAGKPRAEAAAEALRFVKSSGAAPEQRVQRFESSQARLVQRKSFAGEERAEPAGAHPAVAFRRGNTRRVRESFAPRGWTILRSVESSGVRPSSGFSVSKPVRHSSSSGRSSPGSREPERRRRAFCFVESPENARQSSGFSVSKPVRRGSSSGRASPGKNVPSQPELVLRQRFAGKPRAGRLGDPRCGGGQFYAP